MSGTLLVWSVLFTWFLTVGGRLIVVVEVVNEVVDVVVELVGLRSVAGGNGCSLGLVAFVVVVMRFLATGLLMVFSGIVLQFARLIDDKCEPTPLVGLASSSLRPPGPRCNCAILLRLLKVVLSAIGRQE